MIIPYDKQLHIIAGLIISAVISLLALQMEYSPWAGFLCAAFAGLVKEVWDRFGRGKKDFLDFWWTGLGGVLPPLLVEGIL